MADNAATVDNKKDDRQKKDKPKGEKKKFGLWRWLKAIFVELKKVSWPPFGKVVKTTLVVLGVVLFFLVALILMDMGFGWLFDRLIENLGDTAFIRGVF